MNDFAVEVESFGAGEECFGGGFASEPAGGSCFLASDFGVGEREVFGGGMTWFCGDESERQPKSFLFDFIVWNNEVGSIDEFGLAGVFSPGKGSD